VFSVFFNKLFTQLKIKFMQRPTSNYWSAIADLIKLLPYLRELTTRSHTLQVATVTNNQDPTEKRKIKVSTEAMGGQGESYWIQAGRSSCYSDEPIPPVGTTVLVGFVEGDVSDGFLLRTLSNNKNPPDVSQSDPINDNTHEIPGDERRQIGGDRKLEVGGDEDITVEGDLTIRCNGEKIVINAPQGDIEIISSGGGNIKIDGSFNVDIRTKKTVNITGDEKITLRQGGATLVAANGYWEITNALGQRFRFGGSNGGVMELDLNGSNMNLINATDIQINGKSIATVGAIDSRGDTIVDRGW
jgi:hypothetical protein